MKGIRFSSAWTSLKLAAGQSRAAWRRYPALRREIRSLPPGPPILVTGMYRCGTSWTGSMLAAPGVWHVHEPFNPNRGLWEDELVYAPGGEERPDIDRLVVAILSGKHRSALHVPHSHRWFLPARILPVRPGRVLIKDPSAALISEYLARHHGFRALVLFRHPAAVAASFVRLGWPTGWLVSRFVERKALVRDWLEPVSDLLREARGRRDLFSAAVLYACVARVLEGFVERGGGAIETLCYEDLCRDPIARFRELYRRLDLPYDERVRSAHQSLCFDEGGGDARSPFSVRRGSAEMAGRWRGALSPSEVEQVRAVWERAGLARYRQPGHWESR